LEIIGPVLEPLEIIGPVLEPLRVAPTSGTKVDETPKTGWPVPAFGEPLVIDSLIVEESPLGWIHLQQMEL
jgi:hypothetical protein